MRGEGSVLLFSVAFSAAIFLPLGISCAEPADGSLEGDLTPERASPAWTGPDIDRPSLTDWVSATNGCLVQKPGAPAWAWMRLVPAPLTDLSYTVETRFRITKCSMAGRYAFPLVFVVSTKGLCATQVTVGRRVKKGSLQVTSAGQSDQFKDDQIIGGKWFTLRLVVEGGVNTVRARAYLDGEKIHDVPDGKGREYDWFHVRSDADDDAWEIDYFRWKNAALDISVPLERPLTTAERMAELLK